MRSVLAASALAVMLAGCATQGGSGTSVAAAPPAPKCEPAPRDLVIKDIAPGSGDPVTGRTAILVGYTGWLYDECAPGHKGTMFDTSEGRPTPLGFMLGAGRVIRGWDEGIVGMKEGGKRLLVIPPETASGAAGAPGGKIPPNSTLVFEVELVKVIQRLPTQ